MKEQFDNIPKGLAILGSTGSIGTQALEIVKQNPQTFQVVALSAHSNADLVLLQIAEFKPKVVAITDEAAYKKVKELAPKGTQIIPGEGGLKACATHEEVQMVLGAIVGFAGLHSIAAAIQAHKTIALANKETLVVAGALIMPMAREKGVAILPVDSEHSAIFQCLQGEENNPIEKIILTASGGPFFGRKPNFLVNVKREHALQHPNWTMGAKITIDSATLMNKGLEMIEAKWLFGLQNEQIEVVIHPQSIIHSLVQFEDGSLKAQLGLPDMKLPIQYALAYPKRLPNAYKRFAFKDYNQLTFEQPDTKTFRNLALAAEAMHTGGTAPCMLNAANEVVVQAFLNNRVGFMEMCDIIEQTLNTLPIEQVLSFETLVEADAKARETAAELVKKSQLSY